MFPAGQAGPGPEARVRPPPLRPPSAGRSARPPWHPGTSRQRLGRWTRCRAPRTGDRERATLERSARVCRSSRSQHPPDLGRIRPDAAKRTATCGHLKTLPHPSDDGPAEDTAAHGHGPGAQWHLGRDRHLKRAQSAAPTCIGRMGHGSRLELGVRLPGPRRRQQLGPACCKRQYRQGEAEAAMWGDHFNAITTQN